MQITARYPSGSSSNGSFKDCTCTINENIHDWVYLSGANVVSKADATDRLKSEVIGIILSKNSDTTCRVQLAGTIAVSGFTAGKLFLSPIIQGRAVSGIPSGHNFVVKPLGYAFDNNTILIQIGQGFFIK